MAEWLHDPRSLSLMGSAFMAVVISIWQGRQTAAAVKEIADWRLTRAVPAIVRLEEQVGMLQEEVGRLRTRNGNGG